MVKQQNNLKTLRKYFSEGNQKVSYRRFKKALRQLIHEESPEGLTIGAMYQFKLKDEIFEKKRSTYLEKAINQSFSPAMVLLAEIYYYQKEYKEAFRLYEMASHLNNATALKEIALAYKFGIHGYEKNLEKADYLLEKSKKGFKWDECIGFYIDSE